MNVTIVATDAVFTDISAACQTPVEIAAVILARPVILPSQVRLLAREVYWVPQAAYTHQSAHRLTIRSDGYVPALARAESTGCVPIWFHTHPGLGSDPRPSEHDHIVDNQLGDLFRLRSGSPYYVALIGAPRPGGMAFTGFVEDGAGWRCGIERMWGVGERLRLTFASGTDHAGLSPEFDRNVRAFGPAIQQTLRALRIGIVGCGGTGSAVAEQLTRLGARALTLIDSDVLSESNVTRVYGSHAKDVGRSKATVLKDHLEQIAPTASVNAVEGLITSHDIAATLIGCDAVFGCTDDNAGRLVLSRLSTYFVTPVIDCGVLLTSGSQGALTGIHGRVTTLIPGQACLVCRNRVDLARAGSEMLTPGERARRVDEGYAPALGDIEPAVVTYTTIVASLAIAELLERLIGFGTDPRPSEILFRGHDRELSTNTWLPREGHYCDTASGRIGLGVTDPLLEQTWPDFV